MNIDTEMTVGQRFKYFRVQKGLSQNELCEGICSYSTISYLENDRKIPSPKTMGKLAERLGVPLRDIMGEQEKGMDINFQIEMMRVYVERGDYGYALNLIHDLGQIDDLLDHQRVTLLISRAECFIKSGNYCQAIELVLPFIESQQTQQTVDDETLCGIYNKLGNAFFRMRDFEKAYSAYEQGYRISLKLPEFGVVSAQVVHNLGLTCNTLSYKEDAKRYLEKSLSFFNSISDMKCVAKTLFELAIATGNVGYMTQARFLYEGLELIREANVVKQHYAFHVEAKVDYMRAVKELKNTAVEFERIGDVGMSVYTASRAIMVCLRNDDLNTAKECLDQAMKRRNRLIGDNPYMLGYYYRAKAELNLCLENYDECIRDSEESSRLCAIMGMYSESGDALEVGAKAYRLQGDFEKAYELAEQVFELWRKSRRRNSN